MIHSSIIVAIVNSASELLKTIFKEASDQLVQRKNTDNANKKELVSRSVNAELLELNKALQSFERRMDTWSKEAKSFRERISVIYEEGLELHRRADKAKSTYEYIVQAVMLFHGLGTIIVQVNYPYFGDLLSVLMVVIFFSAFVVAFLGNSENNKRMSQLEKHLRGRQRELLNEITNFGATVERFCSKQECKIFICNGALGEVLDMVDLVKRQVASLQSTVTSLLELSSSLESNRIKSLYQVAVVAVIYGLGFPMMAYYFLYFVGFRRMGPIISM